MAVAQFVPEFRLAAIPLLAIGGCCAIRAVDHWARCERAMRQRRDLPASRFPAVLALAIGLGALVLLIIVVVRSAP
ncbi:membrane protein [Nocardia seriolae]|nr:membrane protein [Nocardia seriolae]